MQSPLTPCARSRRRSWSATVALAGTLGVAALAGCGTAEPVATSRAVAPTAAVRAALYTATTPSWNGNIACTATVTTLAAVLGTQKSALGGATFAGGGFRPGIPDRRSITPPCSVNGVPTFVELRRVMVGSCTKINRDGDWTCGLRDPARPAGDLNRIHIETDSKLRAKGGWSIPAGGKLIDVQGFVFWDPDHTTAAFHNHSGWELHSFTAWRYAQ